MWRARMESLTDEATITKEVSKRSVGKVSLFPLTSSEAVIGPLIIHQIATLSVSSQQL